MLAIVVLVRPLFVRPAPCARVRESVTVSNHARHMRQNDNWIGFHRRGEESHDKTRTERENK